jgi:hypothetical protein
VIHISIKELFFLSEFGPFRISSILYIQTFGTIKMSHLPRYDQATGAPASSPPSDNEYDFNNNNNEKKDNNYLPSEGVYVGADGDGPREEETIRALKPRQISMIAIGGAIGTGESRARAR